MSAPAPAQTSSFTSAAGIVKKGPYMDLSHILVDHPAPFVRCTAEVHFNLHAIDIVELVTGQTESTASDTWDDIQKTDRVFREYTHLNPIPYLLPHFSAWLVEELPGNMTQEQRTLLANTFHEIDKAAQAYDLLPLKITTVMHEYRLVDNKSADIAKAVGLIAAQLYRQEFDDDPPKIQTPCGISKVVETNAYTNSDRDLLQSAYDMYMKQHPKRKRCAS